MKFVITLLSIVVFNLLNSQENKTLAKVIYEQIITTSYSENVKEYMLLFDENSSLYKEIIDNKTSAKKIISETEEGIPRIIFMPERKKGLESLFYNSYNTDFYFQSIHNGEHILLTKEEGNKINWKIMDEFKRISEFKCQKAIGFFRGREYTAWFTSEISVPFGPWKLHGLPGLILEAYDTDQMIYVVAKSITQNIDNISLSDKIKDIDKKSLPKNILIGLALCCQKVQNH